MEKGKKRMAVLVGCNYPNTPNELHGCINDVISMKEMLINRFGFDQNHIQLLTDAPGTTTESKIPTGANIKKALYEMVDQSEPGDVLFFHYSGHGTTIPSLLPFRHDEAIVPCDFNLITDMDFRQLVNRVPKGATFTMLSDSCHSGGLIDKEKEQIGPNSLGPSKTKTAALSCNSKAIPFEFILEHLKSVTGINTSDIGTHLLEWFGGDASLKFRVPLIEFDPYESLREDQGILLSGCQANETSADMNPSEGGGKAYGAFSNAVEIVLKGDLGAVSNKEVVVMARKVLEDNGFHEQHPCLYSSDHNADAVFLCHHP
ncbi:metacaspase-9 [Euphorbia lathyris]|uniref:metacaspase-9 n=1 Tax=Euphorbia lathyris TaxID=212925 RepID=UPI0033132751